MKVAVADGSESKEASAVQVVDLASTRGPCQRRPAGRIARVTCAGGVANRLGCRQVRFAGISARWIIGAAWARSVVGSKDNRLLQDVRSGAVGFDVA